MRTFINTCGIVFIMIVLLSFSMKNNHQIDIHYYYDVTIPMPAWAVIIVPFFTGVIMGNILDVVQRYRLKREVKRLKREFKEIGSP